MVDKSTDHGKIVLESICYFELNFYGYQLSNFLSNLFPVVQTLDSAIQRINNYPACKYNGN